jgi:hypothetical protein
MDRFSPNGATTDGQSSPRRSKVVLELHDWMGRWVAIFFFFFFFFFSSDASTILSFFVTSAATWSFVSGTDQRRKSMHMFERLVPSFAISFSLGVMFSLQQQQQ